MRLKSIEIKGFKSFYQKTKIEFPDGIISIVGPNGSGKSNILDAFRWVLGEQSAKNLRGEKMEDVIFSGTKKHRQVNSCEVEIILDNVDESVEIDFSEISIKRKAYRDGDTKYYLNGSQCRLKDIRELFFDSGIGKEGYSIISQGKIDEIINASSLERRKLLEEASGITRYRYKKEESEKMINESKENLDRLMDIFQEIDRQLRPLTEQKEKAISYLELEKQFRELDISLMMRDYQDLLESSKGIDEQKEEISQKLEKIGRTIEEARNQELLYQTNIEGYRAKLQEIDRQKNIIQLNRNDKKNQVESHNEKISIRKELLEKSQKERQLAEKDMEALKSRESLLEEEEEALTKDLTHKQRDKVRLQEEIIQLLGKIEELEKSGRFTRRENEELLSEIALLKSQISYSENDYEREKIQRQGIEVRLGKSQELSLDLAKDMERDLEIISALEDELETLSQKKAESNKSIQDQKESLLKLDKERQEIIQKYREAETKHRMYHRMETDMEGFNKSVKTVLENRSLDGIIDTVASIIKTDKKYEKAIETALGASLQHIITRDSQSAKKAVEYLKISRAGRATFIPLDGSKATVLNLEGVRIASDLVDCQTEYKNLVQSLLGRTLISEDMDQAIGLSKKYNYRYRIVTLDGEVFNPGGSITGGHYYKSNDLLSRKRFIRELEDQLEEFRNESSQKSQLLSQLQEKIGVGENYLLELNQSYQRLEEKLADQKAKYTNKEIKRDYIQKEIEALRADSLVSNDRQGLGQELNQTRERLGRLKIELEEKRASLEALEEEKRAADLRLEAKKEEKNRLEIALASLENKLENLRQDKDRIGEEEERLARQLKDRKSEVQEFFRAIESSENEIQEARLELELLGIETDEIDAEREEFEKLAKLEEERKSKNLIQLKKVEEDEKKLLEEKYKVESSMEKKILIEDHIRTKLSEDYEMTIEEAMQMPRLEKTKKELEALKRKIQALGNINLDAISEYDLLAERHETYRVQIEDLDESIKGLELIIEKLEKDMAIEFEAHFQEINRNFADVFSKIFGGGEAKLILSNPQDVLNSNIEIMAQPPGKKLRTMTVLSGGEKSLMGIAVLFAIQMTKPAPFCILDEIDAALDDTNINRFTAFLKEMSKDIQFINITHRRGTMEIADYIYGVTMQDKGVSNIVSIRFEDAEDYIEQ